MPELPEVEVTAQALRPALVGGQVVAWTCSGKRLRHPLPRRALADLVGQPLLAVGRRAKYVLLEFPQGWLAVHWACRDRCSACHARNRHRCMIICA
jgi:formamidopyrimidine-DNA glycosylase